MAYEVEMKAWVDDWDAMEARLRGMCRFIRDFRKDDRYYLVNPEPATEPGDGASGAGRSERGFRVRVDAGRACVTFKRKERHRRAEINMEREFEVDDVEAFNELMRRIGLEPQFTKVKEGLEFEHDGLVIELVHVRELGDFLEVECVDERDDASAHQAAAQRIEGFFTRCGVDPERIETAPYMKLLRRIRSGPTDAGRAT